MYPSGERQRSYRPASAYTSGRPGGGRKDADDRPPSEVFDEAFVQVQRLGRTKKEGGDRPGGSITYLLPLGVQDPGDPGRPAPGLEPRPETGEPEPGQWLPFVPYFQGGWRRRIHCVVYDPGLYNPADDWDYIKSLPICYLRERVWQATKVHKSRPDLEYLIVKHSQDGYDIGDVTYYSKPLPGVLGREDGSYLMRALVLGRGDEPFSPPQGFGPEDKVPLFVLDYTKYGKLLAALARPLGGGFVPGGMGALPISDPTDLQAPNVICTYRDGDDPMLPPQQRKPPTGGYNIVRFQGLGPQWPDPIGADPRQLAQYFGQVLPRLVPWHRVYKVADEERQMHLIAGAFDAAVVRWAFAERADMLAIAERAWANVATHPPAGVQPPGAAPAGNGYPPDGGGYPAQAGYPAAAGYAAPAAPAAAPAAYPAGQPSAATGYAAPAAAATPAGYAPPAAAPAAAYPAAAPSAEGERPISAAAAQARLAAARQAVAAAAASSSQA